MNKKPTLAQLKRHILECRHYVQENGFAPLASQVEVKLGGFAGRFGCGIRQRPNKDGMRQLPILYFHLAGNYYDSVAAWDLVLTGTNRRLVLAAEPILPAPLGLSRAWKVFYADQTKNRRFLRPCFCYCAELEGQRGWGYPLAKVHERLWEPYRQALMGENL